MSRNNLARSQRLLAGISLIFAFVAPASADAASESRIIDETPSWLCKKVKEVADEVPFHNVIGFKEGNFMFLGPTSERRIRGPEGCHEKEIFVSRPDHRDHPAGHGLLPRMLSGPVGVKDCSYGQLGFL